jgi:cholesterol transport system auxiliary component
MMKKLLPLFRRPGSYGPRSKRAKHTILKSLVLGASTLALTACSLGPIKTPPVAQYFLQPLDIHMKYAYHRGRPKTILMASIQSAPGYQTNAMHYVITPYQLQSFSTHTWISPPAKLWQPLLETALSHAQVGIIVHTPTPANTDYRLDIRLDKFEQNFQKPQSVFVMQATVTLQNIHTGYVTGAKTFDVTLPAQKNTPYAGVLAANRVVSEMDKDIVAYLERLIR